MTKTMKDIASAMKDAVNNYRLLHVRLQGGNRKTGAQVWTVSLLPVVDCCNCAKCKATCYDLLHDLVYPSVREDRAKNLAIHQFDAVRYWREVGEELVRTGARFIRINVGGDMADADFNHVAVLGRTHPEVEFLFFTKNYRGLNIRVRENGMMPSNVHAIVSRWPGMPCRNPYRLPEAHVRMRDGTTTAPKGAIECNGNCSACAETKNGCFGLARYQSVVFDEH